MQSSPGKAIKKCFICDKPGAKLSKQLHIATHIFQAYYFPALDSTNDKRCLGYALFGKEPDSELAYDDTRCEAVADHDTLRCNCRHTFHKFCFFRNETDHGHSYAIPGEGSKCPIC